jgi:hypothetical protein
MHPNDFFNYETDTTITMQNKPAQPNQTIMYKGYSITVTFQPKVMPRYTVSTFTNIFFGLQAAKNFIDNHLKK